MGKLNKNGIALPFNWMFAIIAGIIILALAIYAATRFIETSEEAVYTETSAQLISLLDPLETGLASGKSAEINFKKETRTYYECDDLSNYPFGKNTIAFSEKTFGDFGEKGLDVPVYNKYVFAENMVEGKDLHVFSKPFFMPFKISDLIVISSDNYCFYQAPEQVKDEIQGLNINNVYFSDDLANCTQSSENVVCFSDFTGCDIAVLDAKVVKGDEDDELYYIGDLLYPAIFSSSEMYECNLKRLMNRFVELSDIYIDKINIIERKGCGSNIGGRLSSMKESAKALNSSRGLIVLAGQSDEIDALNQATTEGCKVY